MTKNTECPTCKGAGWCWSTEIPGRRRRCEDCDGTGEQEAANMENNEHIEKELATASLKAAVDLIQGIDAALTIAAIRTRINRVADDLMEAACEKL